MDIGKVGDKTSSTAVKAEFKKNWVHRLLELFPDLVLRSGSKPSFFDIRRPVKLMALPVIVPFKILCFIPCTFLWNYFSIGKVLHSKNRVIVEGVNKAKKHIRPTQDNPQGGIVEKELSIHVSNLMLIHKGNPIKVGFKILKDGKKVRINKKNSEVVD